MVILTSLAKLEVLCSNQSVTGGLIRPTNISFPSKVLVSAAVESKALIQININHLFALFHKFSVLFAIHIFLESHNCTTTTPVYL